MHMIRLGDKIEGSKFQWRVSRYEYVLVEDMSNSNLLYTLKMLWNNHAPVTAKVRETMPTEYSLMPSYSQDYVANAIRAMTGELERRFTSLSKLQQRELLHIRLWFSKPIELRNVRQHSWRHHGHDKE
jgi:hypothetical protein